MKRFVISVICILAVIVAVIGIKSILPVKHTYIEVTSTSYSLDSSNAGITTVLR